MSTPAPVSVVVDCSATGAPDPKVAEEFHKAAVDILANAGSNPGDMELALERAAKLMQDANEILTAAAVPTETVVPLTDAEIAQQQTDAAAALVSARAARAEQVKAALAATDPWAARAVEDAVPMPAARIDYRQQLRGLFATIDAAPDFANLDAIEIPAPPADAVT